MWGREDEKRVGKDEPYLERTIANVFAGVVHGTRTASPIYWQRREIYYNINNKRKQKRWQFSKFLLRSWQPIGNIPDLFKYLCYFNSFGDGIGCFLKNVISVCSGMFDYARKYYVILDIEFQWKIYSFYWMVKYISNT